MDTDILKPDTGYLHVIERPTHTSSKGSDRTSSGDHTPSEEGYVEPVSEGEEDENIDLAPAKDEDKRTGLSGVQVAEAVAYREQMLKTRRQSEAAAGKTRASITNGNGHDADEEAIDSDHGEDVDERTAFLKGKKNQGGTNGAPHGLSIDPLAPSSAFDETLRNRLRRENAARQQVDTASTSGDGDEAGSGGEDAAPGSSRTHADDPVHSREWSAPTGKLISVPVRIEPKVFFAAERTFLVSEMNITIKLTSNHLTILC